MKKRAKKEESTPHLHITVTIKLPKGRLVHTVQGEEVRILTPAYLESESADAWNVFLDEDQTRPPAWFAKSAGWEFIPDFAFPTGRGAVIEDNDGLIWFRLGEQDWVHDNGQTDRDGFVTTTFYSRGYPSRFRIMSEDGLLNRAPLRTLYEGEK